MKVLNHPVFVGLLGVAAVGMMVNQVLPVQWLHWPVRTGGKPASVAPPPVLPETATNSGLPDLLPLIDPSYPQSRLSEWLATPQRDPFWQARPAAPPGQTNTVHQLKLLAIWLQGGTSMAAINHGLYRPGDSVDGCLVEAIDDNGVWLEVNGQKGFLHFSGPIPGLAAH